MTVADAYACSARFLRVCASGARRLPELNMDSLPYHILQIATLLYAATILSSGILSS